ncbi:hypothetical protein ACFLT2_14755, partial [Acidobacteriota bacterium]
EKISGKSKTVFHKQEFVFLYTTSPNKNDSKYFQIVTISQKGQAARLFSHVFGSRLRWGEGYVENPFVQITDLEDQELARLVIHEGKLGEQFEIRGQAKKSMPIPLLPKRYKIYAGFEFYSDGENPHLSGGPSRVDLITPTESED